MSVGNGGNVATETTLMDVLPVGTTLDYATIWEGGNNVPFPPDSNENGVLTWDMGELEPGAGFDINLRLNIDKDARPYSPFDNCIKVAIADTDVRPFDNEDCVEDTLQPAGPNVRVTKEHRWHDGETGLEYQLNIMNLGSTNLENVQVVDTYPEGVSFNGEWWHDLWEDVQLVDHDEEQRTLTWEISRMDPSWSFRIWFDVELDGDKVGVEGLTFTNVVDMPVTGDVNPDDNSDSDVAVTGPDLYIKKWLKDPSKIVKPGDDVAFVIEFGNASHRWGTRGDTLIEDQLPDGMTFVSATDPDDYTQEWDPRQDGNELQWFWGDIGDDNTWFFELTVKIDDTVKLGEVLTNQIEIDSLNNEDIDPLPENNIDDAPVPIGRFVYLPVVLKP